MLHLLKKAGLEHEFVIDSAGILSCHQGELPDSRMRAHAGRRGYELVHRSRPVRTEDFYDFDLILGMDDRNIADLNDRAPGPEEQKKIHRMTDYCTRIPTDHVPDYIFFKYPDSKEDYKAKLPDLMMIINGLLVISEKFRDLLVGFDIGTTLVHEVPLYEHDQKTRRSGRWFILHITANKKTVIPEMSENVEQIGKSGHWRSRIAQEDILAVRADAGQGADLWIDASFRGRIFLSDCLKSALKPAGIRVLKMPMRPCIVIA